MNKPPLKEKHNDNWKLVQSDRSQIGDESIVSIHHERSPKRFKFYIILVLLVIVALFLVGWFFFSPKLASKQITNLNQTNPTTQTPQGQDPNNEQSKKDPQPTLKAPESNKNTLTPPHKQPPPNINLNNTQKPDNPPVNHNQPPPIPPQNLPPRNPPSEIIPPSDSSKLDSQPNEDPIATEEERALCKAQGFTVHPKGPKHRKIYDLFLIRNELELLELRLGQMYDEVDYFVILESPVAFTGAAKNLSVLDNWDMFKPYHSKMIRHTLDLKGNNFPNTWKREEYSRNAMYLQLLPYLTGDQKVEMGDVILVSDVDELVKNEALRTLRACDFPKKLTLGSQFYFYSYQFDHFEEWPHPQATYYDGANTVTPNELRAEQFNPGRKTYHDSAWHCSYCFPRISDIAEKLQTFSHQEFNREEYTNRTKILHRVRHGLDLFGDLNWKFKITENNTDIPDFIKANKEKYTYMLERKTRTGNFIDFREEDAVLN